MSHKQKKRKEWLYCWSTCTFNNPVYLMWENPGEKDVDSIKMDIGTSWE